MIYYPLYYGEFKCIADKCPDSCCKNWEIVIDTDTYNKYTELTGELGRNIRFCLDTDEDGDNYFMLLGNRCPFFDCDGLCIIHKKLGEDLTSKICREHPRFFEEYDGFTEVSLSLSCPESARIILSQNPGLPLYEAPVYDGDDDDILKTLIVSREELLSPKTEFFYLAAELMRIACRDEEDINFRFIEPIYIPDIVGIKEFIKILLSKCEILMPSWKEKLENALEFDDDKFTNCVFIRENEKEIVNVFFYYVYRYYLKAVCDLEIYPRALFIVFSVLASVLIAQANGLPFGEAARLYSKEIEHSTENIDIILNEIDEF